MSVFAFVFLSLFTSSLDEIPMPSEVRPHVMNFGNLARSHNVFIDPAELTQISFATEDKFPGRKVAYCNLMMLGLGKFTVEWPFHKEIVISKQWWIDTSEVQHEQLVFHELAHCFLSRDHTCLPNSIMGPRMYPEWIYAPQRDMFVKELFHPDRDLIASTKCQE